MPTGGILPAYLDTIDYSAWFTNGSFVLPATHSVSRLLISGFSSNYSMVQQGECIVETVGMYLTKVKVSQRM
jgi:hypothetical protein